MRVDLFNFELPEDLIANEPVFPRENGRVLHINGNTFSDKHVFDLPNLLNSDDILVFNDTKVLPARIYGFRGMAKIEATLMKQVDLSTWKCLIKNSRRLKIDDIIHFDENLNATVIRKDEYITTLQFNKSGSELFSKLYQIGIMPLPPYIKRGEKGEETDKSNYQTIFAKNEGAVAAPTAGLHFTKELFKKLDEKGIQKEFLTLHVGGGTFLPVKVEDTDNHIMHSEFGNITKEVADRLNQYKKQGRRIIAVGTTALRLLESASDDAGILHEFNKETDIFITPGYRFKFTDALWTNFHLPCSTLFMLVCAFAGIDTMKQAYQHAIQEKYRFFSYGDACFIEHSDN